MLINTVKLPLKSVFEFPKYKWTSIVYLWPKKLVTRNLLSGTNIKDNPDKVLVFVPGNPGIPEYYIDYLNCLHSNLKQQIDIVLIGHLGQTNSQSLQQDCGDVVYSLEEQVKHKMACLEKLKESYPEDTEYYLMGHSMGSWVIEQVVKAMGDSFNIKHIYLLFPSLCDIRKTPNGVVIGGTMLREYPLIFGLFLLFLFSYLPRSLRLKIVGFFTNQSEKNAIITTDKLLIPKVALNACRTGQDEMATIMALDEDFYTEYQDRLTIYYGENDGWSPREHYVRMKKLIPNGNVIACIDKIPHAFILEHSEPMAKKVATWMLEHFNS